MLDRPYYQLMDQICRSNGWVLGQDKGEMVLGVPQEGDQQSVVVNEFQDASGQLCLRLWSPVVAQGVVPSDQALTINFQLPHCALAEREGQIVVTGTRTWNQTNQADLTSLVSTLSYYAAFYRRHYGG